VNDHPLDVNIRELTEDIVRYRSRAAGWWSYNKRRAGALIGLSVLASFGATVAGILGYPHTAGIFAAVGASVIALQGAFKLGEKAYKYGQAMTECDRLIGKLRFQTKAPEDFDGVLAAFYQLRQQEGTEDNPTPVKEATPQTP
jgi:hypothetical protein